VGLRFFEVNSSNFACKVSLVYGGKGYKLKRNDEIWPYLAFEL